MFSIFFIWCSGNVWVVVARRLFLPKGPLQHKERENECCFLFSTTKEEYLPPLHFPLIKKNWDFFSSKNRRNDPWPDVGVFSFWRWEGKRETKRWFFRIKEGFLAPRNLAFLFGKWGLIMDFKKVSIMWREKKKLPVCFFPSFLNGFPPLFHVANWSLSSSSEHTAWNCAE